MPEEPGSVSDSFRSVESTELLKDHSQFDRKVTHMPLRRKEVHMEKETRRPHPDCKYDHKQKEAATFELPQANPDFGFGFESGCTCGQKHTWNAEASNSDLEL